LWPRLPKKRHGKDICLKIPPYDHWPDIEIIVVKMYGSIYISK
jgi:hypothetical protein